MASDKTYYELLEVLETASQQVIRAAYRDLSQQWHPDKHPEGGKAAAERMSRKLNEAYDVLSDPVKRAHYDKTLNGRKERAGAHSTSDSGEGQSNQREYRQEWYKPGQHERRQPPPGARQKTDYSSRSDRLRDRTSQRSDTAGRAEPPVWIAIRAVIAIAGIAAVLGLIHASGNDGIDNWFGLLLGIWIVIYIAAYPYLKDDKDSPADIEAERAKWRSP